MNSYDNIIQEELAEGIIKKVTAGSEFFLPHKPVICKSAESTKVRIVFDALQRLQGKVNKMLH